MSTRWIAPWRMTAVDMALAILVPQSLVDPVEVAKAMIASARKTEKPVVLVCLMGETTIKAARKILDEHCQPMVDYPEASGPVFGALRQYAAFALSAGVKNTPVLL